MIKNDNEQKMNKIIEGVKKLLYYVKVYTRISFDWVSVKTKTQYEKIHEEEIINFLPVVSAAYRRKPTLASRALFYSISIFFLFLFLWVFFMKIEEIVHATGEVEPSSNVKVVSHLEGGVIKDILVKEGDFVKEDQPLIKLKNIVPLAAFQEAEENYHRNLAHIARLQAEIEGKDLSLPEEVVKSAPEIAKEVMSAFQSRQFSLKNEQSIAQNQIRQKESELEELVTKSPNLEESTNLAQQQVDVMEEAKQKNVGTKTGLIRSKIELNDKKTQLDSVKSTIPKAKAALGEAEERLRQIKAHYDQEAWAELKDRKARLAEAKKIITAEKDRMSRTTITAPVTGIVQEIMVKTVGSAIQSAQNLISIVPVNDNLVIEAQVSPTDIGLISLNTHASIKVSSYDFSIYGDLKAVVKEISPTTAVSQTPDKQPFFRVHLQTERNYLLKDGKKYFISPGMTVQVDLITAKRTILEFILKPIIKTLNDSVSR